LIFYNLTIFDTWHLTLDMLTLINIKHILITYKQKYIFINIKYHKNYMINIFIMINNINNYINYSNHPNSQSSNNSNFNINS